MQLGMFKYSVNDRPANGELVVIVMMAGSEGLFLRC